MTAPEPLSGFAGSTLVAMPPPPRVPPQRLRYALAAAAALAALQLAALPAAAAVPTTSCPMFPANNVWNTDISSVPVHASSGAWITASGGTGRLLHPDFGSSGDPNAPYGIPYIVVDSSHAKVNPTFQYASESDSVGYPFGPDTPIEGGGSASGDRHALVVDRGSCRLYELYDARYQAGGSTAGSGAVYDLRGNALRPAGWTSADAAGLPILPGLLRLDEVNSGAINHAIRFTVQRTAASFVWPARHQAGSGPAAVNPPMGARFRMKAGIDVSNFSPQTRVVLTAFKHYGMIVADNGSNWFFQGEALNNWPDQLITELKRIPAGDFEAVDEASLMVDPNSAQARQPGPAAAPPPPPAVKQPAVVVVPPAVAAEAAAPSEAAPTDAAEPAADREAAPNAPRGAAPGNPTGVQVRAVTGAGVVGKRPPPGVPGSAWWSIGLGMGVLLLMLLTHLGMHNRPE